MYYVFPSGSITWILGMFGSESINFFKLSTDWGTINGLEFLTLGLIAILLFMGISKI